MLATVGHQVGLFVERKQAEEELNRFFTPRRICSASRASRATSSA
jgi:hypothetical protein